MQQLTFKQSLALAACGAAFSLASAAAAPLDDALARVVPPPLSYPTAQAMAKHPDAFLRMLAKLPARPGTVAVRAARRFTSTAGGTWAAVTNAPSGGLANPVLLTDGTVIVSVGDSPNWYKLTPDANGNYAAGTWTKIAALPTINGKAYGPLYHSTGVLPDGRVIIMGGEYDNSNKGVWTNAGAIYDPVADSWTAVNPPNSTLWGQIGDSQSVVLSNGVFLQAACCAYNPDSDALFAEKTQSWRLTGAPRFGAKYQDEQGYELLPNGNVLTIDVWTNVPQGGAANAEMFVPASKKWVSAGSMPASLVDPAQCGNWEIGPAALRGDGTVVAFGGNTGCIAGATTDPTDIYNSATNSWVQGPDIPAVCGTDGATSCTLADAPAAVLPNGNILFAASSGYGNAPTHFFEMGTDNTISQVSDTVANASTSGSYFYNFLVLPNGQVLSTDFSKTPEVYTPAGTPVAAYAPAVTKVAYYLATGTTYKLAGKQLGGVTQGGYYGDDYQGATNFPIVKITNTATGAVTYARSFGFSNMSVTPGMPGTLSFVLPNGMPTGPSTLSVVASGNASAPVPVVID